MPRSRTSGGRRRRGHERDVDRHCDPRASASFSLASAPWAANQPEAFNIEVARVVEIDADERIAAVVVFDPDDIDAAFAELDARYLAGEAAAHAHTWSVIARGLRRAQPARASADDAGLGQRRPPASDTIAPGELSAYIRAGGTSTPDLSIHVEAVHRLSDLGAVVTHASHGTSQEGFDAEWRVIDLLTVDGDLINRCELFDEADLDAALARFDELSRSAAAGKRGKPSSRALPGILHGPRLGRHGRDHWPTTCPPTIVVGW